MDYGTMILPDGKHYSLDDKKTRINNNVMVVGTTGSAKTRTMVVPNLMECHGSYIVTDPKGNLYNRYGKYMREQGYRVKRLSFIHPEKSVHYDPMAYVETTQEMQQLSSLLASHTQGRNNDPYWEDSALILFNSIIGLIKEGRKVDMPFKGFNDIVTLLRFAGKKEGTEISALSEMMEELYKKNRGSWAYRQYRGIAQAPEKTHNCTVTTALTKLNTLDTNELARMLSRDEIDIKSIGKRKTAVFVEISDTDRSMDILANIFFTQAMSQLCRFADEECVNNELPVPVRFIMDDFATNCRIDNFDNMISNIRSRKISVMIILQSLKQLEKGYEENAHTIIDDCDTLVYMGGNDPGTASQIALRVNKTTTTILHMPLCTSWIIRRGEKPVMCTNFELDDYLKKKEAELNCRCLPTPAGISGSLSR